MRLAIARGVQIRRLWRPGVTLRLVPLPMHDDKSGKEHYAKYDDLKLAPTNYSDMPSYEPPKVASKEAKQADKAKPVNFHVQKVRHRIICDECGKPRTIV